MGNYNKIMSDINELVHFNTFSRNSTYPLIFIGYEVKKYGIDLNGKFETFLSFIIYLKDSVDNQSLSNDEKGLLSESLNYLMKYNANCDLKRITTFIDNYNREDYLEMIRINYNFDRYGIGTSNNLYKLIVSLFNTKKNGSVIDLSCGSGDFLTSMIDNDITLSVTGYDKNLDNLLFLRIRMYMLNCDYTVNTYYSLNEIATDTSFDSIFCIPEFGLKIDREEINCSNFETKKNNSYYWEYVDKALSLLNSKGKAIFILPKAPMFKVPDSNIREYLIKNKLVETIIELPENIFTNTTMGAVLLVLSRNNNTTRIIDATDMFIKSNRIKNDIDIIKIIDSLKNNTEFSKTVVQENFVDNNYSFIATNYTKDISKNMERPVLLKNYITATRGYRGVVENKSNNNTYKHLKLSNIIDGEIIKDSLESIDYNESLDKFLLQDKDVVITARGSRFECAIVQLKEDEKIVCGENFFILRVVNSELNPYYLCAYLNSDKGKDAIFSKQMRTTVLILKSDSLLDTYIDLISKDKQLETEQLTKSILFAKEGFREEVKKLNDKLNNLV